jgi:hypothetical protein
MQNEIKKLRVVSSEPRVKATSRSLSDSELTARSSRLNMNTTRQIMLTVDYSKKDLRNASFKDENLVNTSFEGSDLRGADFTGADLTGANLTNVKTGITPRNNVLIFSGAAIVSMFSGFVAVRAGTTIHAMLRSADEKIRISGIATLAVILLFIVYYYFRGGRTVIKHILIPVFILSALIGTIGYFSGWGSGRGMLFLLLSLLQVIVMVIIGTIARSFAGLLSSSTLFILVGAAGSLFGGQIGGDIGAAVMAISCAILSKRALSSAKGFDIMKELAYRVTKKFGTSFRNANLKRVNFSGSVIHNADFTNANASSVNWGDSQRLNCTPVSAWAESGIV